MLSFLRRIRHQIGRHLAHTAILPENRFPDISASDYEFLTNFTPYTMTSIERRYHLLSAVRYIVKHNIDGDILECGVWRGGSMMLAANSLQALGCTKRRLFLFDTFSGMPAPGPKDFDFADRSAQELLRIHNNNREKSHVWAIASRGDVDANMKSTGYPYELINFIEGRVEETIPSRAPDKIALLRLDTDWYESTRHELVHLWPRLSQGGVLIIDDYGYWKGAREAVDEFFASLSEPVLLHRIDDTGRATVKHY